MFRVDRYLLADAPTAQRFTVGLVAKAIREGSSYLPIRNLAASLASTARPKDYLGQVRAIYNDFINRWRYVRDTYGVETLAASPNALWKLVLAGDGRGVGAGYGAGDCDDAAAAIGAELAAIGMPIRIATARNPDSTRQLFSHIFVQANVPGHGWISVDPVGHPAHGFAWTPPHNAIATWDLDGRQIAGDRLLDGGEDQPMQYHGFGALGSSDQYNWQEYPLPFPEGDGSKLLPFDVYGLAGYGCYVGELGYLEDGRGYLIEVDDDDVVNGYGAVQTPMLELQPGAYELVSRHGIVLDGTLALGDDGSVYEYDGAFGFFKKIWGGIKKVAGGIKKGVKKVTGGIRKGVRKAFEATKFGRALIKIKDKVLQVATKIVNPIMKVVGKWATRIAPIAAMIPGIGPVLAAYLTAAGTIAKTYNKYGVKIVEFAKHNPKTGKKEKSTKLVGKPKNILKARKALIAQSKQAARLPKSELKKKAKLMRDYKGKTLPREPIWGKKSKPKKLVIKRGTPEYRAAMQAMGLKRGAFAPDAAQKVAAKKKGRRRPPKAVKVGKAQVVARGPAAEAQGGPAQMLKEARQAGRRAARKEFRRLQRRAA